MLIDDVARTLDECAKALDKREMVRPYVNAGAILDLNGAIIDAQSAYDYLYEKTGPSYDSLWSYVRDHLYVIIPPTIGSWIEWSDHVGKIGAICLSRRFADFVSTVNKDMVPDWVIDANPVLMLDISFFCSKGYLPFAAAVFIRSDGTLITSDSLFCLVGKADDDCEDSEFDGKFNGAILKFVSITLFTLSLLNIKNVVRREHRPDEKLQKKRIKNGKRPLVKYYTLEVEAPGNRFIGGDKPSTTTNGTSSRPLHLVRGHLADYRDGKGLFGKYKGVYWMPAHFRGDADNGVINKRYKVKTSN